MKTLPLAASLLLMVLSPSHGQTVYEFDVTSSAPSSRNWTHPATWVGAPSSYPGTDDHILYKAYKNSRTLVADQSQLQVDEFEFSGTVDPGSPGDPDYPQTAASQRLFAAEEVQSTVTIGTFRHLATGSSFHFANSTSANARLSVVIDTLQTASNTTIEIGHNGLGSLESFEAATSNIAGTLNFTGIKERAAGQNRLSLGALNLTGTVYLGFRGNTNGILEVSSLTGSGYIYLATSTHLGNHGTVEINSQAASSATFSGLLRTSNVANPSPTVDVLELGLHKKGEGTQILSLSTGHAYRGPTVIEEGVLAVTNTSGSGLGWGEVTVKGEGILAGSGRLAQEKSVTVEAGGQIAPSAHLATGVTTLTLDGAGVGTQPILTIDEGGAFRFRFGADNASDQIHFTSYGAGDFTLATTIQLHGEAVQEGTFSLFTFNSIDGSELETLAGSLIAGDGFSGYHARFSSSENTIFLQVDAIPEPGSVALGLTALAGLWAWRRFSIRS